MGLTSLPLKSEIDHGLAFGSRETETGSDAILAEAIAIDLEIIIDVISADAISHALTIITTNFWHELSTETIASSVVELHAVEDDLIGIFSCIEGCITCLAPLLPEEVELHMESARALMGEADSGAYAMRIVIIIIHLHASHLGGNRLLRHLLSGGPHRAMHALLGAIGHAQSDRVVAIDIKSILSTDDYIPVAHSHHMLELRASRAGIGEDIIDYCAEIIAEIRTERESGERTGDTEVDSP